MSSQLAFVSDIHGMVDDLKIKLSRAEKLNGISKYIFLGDYINRGPDSKETIDYLVSFSKFNDCVFLRGNHDEYFIEAITNRLAFGKFLARGGIPTVRSYVKEADGDRDIYTAFLRSVPEAHVSLFQQMPRVYENEDLIASHDPNALPRDDPRFKISAHRFVSTPILTTSSASIDTGSGFSGGFISILLWPSLQLI